MQEKIEINESIRADLDAFFLSGIINKKVDFISLQRENPNPDESSSVTVNELTEEKLVAVIRATNKSIWGD